MLVVTDIGNTHTVVGVYDGSDLLGTWRVVSATHRTSDEYAAYVLSLFALQKIDASEISDAIIGSVVPALTGVWEDVWKRATGVAAMVVGPGMKTGLDIQYENPREVGADRILNCVAGLAKFGAPLIAVDFGTATTLDVCLKPNVYLGGMIAPGVQLALDALTARAARLPNVSLRAPEQVVGRNTVDSILSGTFYGYVSLVDGLIRRAWNAIGTETGVVATGGLAEKVFQHSELIGHIEPHLTLDGLRLLYEMNN
ncbi:MAG: type III pantothenate kinase [bacterium]|jgi:type III pantothenate kinase